MSQRVSQVLSVAIVGILAAACGGGETSVDVGVSEQIPTTTNAVVETDPTTPSDTVPLETEPDVTTVVAAAGLDPTLSAALENSVNVGALRVLSYSAQTLQIEVLGVNTVGVFDLDSPTAVLESDGEGSSFFTLDLRNQFAATAPDLAQGPPIELRFWNTPGLLFIDTTDYSAIEEMNPGQLGVFSPGVFTVDTKGIVDADGEELVTAIAGAPVTDIGDLATGLLDKLGSATLSPDADDTYFGQLSFGQLLEVQGSSSREAASAAAAGIAGVLGFDGQDLADLYVDFYDATDIDVEITIGDVGTLESFAFEADLSDLYDRISELLLADPGASSASPAEVEEVRSLADAVFVLETRMVYEPDESIMIEPPSGDLEDRTDELVAFLQSSGVDFSD